MKPKWTTIISERLPKPDLLLSFLFASIRLLALFAVVFYGMDYVTKLRSHTYSLYFPFELEIPYIPAALLVYSSVFFLPFLVPLTVLSISRINLWRTQMSATIVIAGIVFFVLPASIGYPQAEGSSLKTIIQLVAGTYNLVPSLHVALTFITVRIIWCGVALWAKYLLGIWTVLLAISTLVTHQHHLLDVVSGILLGIIVALYFESRTSTEPKKCETL